MLRCCSSNFNYSSAQERRQAVWFTRRLVRALLGRVARGTTLSQRQKPSACTGRGLLISTSVYYAYHLNPRRKKIEKKCLRFKFLLVRGWKIQTFQPPFLLTSPHQRQGLPSPRQFFLQVLVNPNEHEVFSSIVIAYTGFTVVSLYPRRPHAVGVK